MTIKTKYKYEKLYLFYFVLWSVKTAEVETVLLLSVKQYNITQFLLNYKTKFPKYKIAKHLSSL